MQVVFNHAAEIAMSTLSEEERRTVLAWRQHLENWENDEFVRTKARRLSVAEYDNVYVLKTSTDVSLFFRLHSDRIEVIDIARKESIEAVGQLT